MEKKLEVLYEDNHVIVVNKPQNIPSQGDSSEDESMLDMVKKHIKTTNWPSTGSPKPPSRVGLRRRLIWHTVTVTVLAQKKMKNKLLKK